MSDKYVVQFYNVTLDYLQKGDILNIAPTQVLLPANAQTTKGKTNHFTLVCRSNTVKGFVSSEKTENCVGELALTQASISLPVSFQPTLTKLNSRSQSSLDKQGTVLEFFHFCSRHASFRHKNIHSASFLPRKTRKWQVNCHVNCTCYAISHGLNCNATTLVGETATQLGVIRLNPLIPMHVGSNIPVRKKAESAVQKLYRDPKKQVFIKILDVLVIEELQMLNSTQKSVLDQTLRFVNNGNSPNGSVSVFSNGNPKQLRPPSGPLIWNSPLLFIIFTFFYLQE